LICIALKTPWWSQYIDADRFENVS
jgi:hypothetical protein